jgi:hypothetical protein
MTNPTVWITPQAKEKLDIYIEAANGEISGLGVVEQAGTNFLIRDVYLFAQTCSPVSTVLAPDDIANFLLQTVQQGLDPSELKLWWHSHDRMNVFWSQTDDETAASFGNGWMLSVVGNKAGDYLCRLDLYDPLRLTMDRLPMQIYLPRDPDVEATLYAEVKAKVRMNTYVRPSVQHNPVQPRQGWATVQDEDDPPYNSYSRYDDPEWWDGRWD